MGTINITGGASQNGYTPTGYNVVLSGTFGPEKLETLTRLELSDEQLHVMFMAFAVQGILAGGGLPHDPVTGGGRNPLNVAEAAYHQATACMEVRKRVQGVTKAIG